MTASPFVILAALLAASPAHAGKRHASLMVDRIDMTATLGETLGAFSTEKSYYDSAPAAGGNHRVADIRDGACRGTYDIGPDNRLLHRERTLRVLEGDFGHVYAHFHYWYPPQAPKIAVVTFSDKRGAPHLPPLIAKTGAGKADGFALIRVVVDAPRFLVATGDYALDGRLKTFRVEVSSGDWVRTQVNAAEVDYALAARFGLPKDIKPETFAASPFGERAPDAPAAALEAALIFRGRGATVERVVRRGSRVDRDWLSFPPSETERALSKVEASYPITRGRGD